jgi:hypothetical protein
MSSSFYVDSLAMAKTAPSSSPRPSPIGPGLRPNPGSSLFDLPSAFVAPSLETVDQAIGSQARQDPVVPMAIMPDPVRAALIRWPTCRGGPLYPHPGDEHAKGGQEQ